MFNWSFLFLSIAKPESVQYFQFNANGDMYVFEPGSGFSGTPKCVELSYCLNDGPQITGSNALSGHVDHVSDVGLECSNSGTVADVMELTPSTYEGYVLL